ncbi:hypothetical protein ACFVGM_06550 [Kitasatospora purpeofusca]|uniref:hypothetical protein n=1 Tax=Kitasatospora purpeofusca TaxID=67352 RepID=UPI0036B21E7F
MAGRTSSGWRAGRPSRLRRGAVRGKGAVGGGRRCPVEEELEELAELEEAEDG